MIIYSGYYVSAKTYALALANKTNQEAINIQDYLKDPVPIKKLVLVTSLYAGSFAHFSKLKKMMKKISPETITLIAVGLSEKDNSHNQKNIVKSAKTLFGSIPYDLYYLTGKIDYGKLSLLHKLMMFGMKKSLENKEVKSKQDQLILNTYGKEMDLISFDLLNLIADSLIKTD